VSRAKSKVTPHVRVDDPDVPADPLHPERVLCRCGLPAGHPSHTMPDPVSDVASAAAGEERR
jgi:hypothetical protein